MIVRSATPPADSASVNQARSRMSAMNPQLESKLQRGATSGAGSLKRESDPSVATMPEHEDKTKRKSKLMRPTKKSKKSSTASKVYGTLPRLMGGGSSKKSKDDEAPPALETSVLSHSHDRRSSKEATFGKATPLASSSDHPLSSSAENPAPAPEESVKWKRGAEAEAILKLLSETKDAMDAEAAGHASAEGSSAPPAPEMVDAEAIMKILGLEEPGIKLPEKAHNGDEKALDPVSELQLTERNFIADLGLLNETFIKPIRTNHILPDSTVDDMALNLDRLISLHRDFYKSFLSDSSLKGISDTFSDEAISELERLYTVYMGHYETALALFYEKRDTVAQFRKYLKQREETMSDKSVPNLLVTPVQRVCKYEMMLASINKTIMKTADPTDTALAEHSRQLLTKIDKLNVALQNVDARRSAADNWDKISQLESNLLLSEPLSKEGRIILLDSDVLMKDEEGEHTLKLVLFNDQLIRTRIPKKSKKARLLNTVPLNHIQIINITQQEGLHYNKGTDHTGERYSFYIITDDPRVSIWTVHFSTEELKKEWVSALEHRTLQFERFCEDWNIPYKKNERLLAADGGSWPQEYVKQCRLFITPQYLCILWKMFGCEERETVPIHMVTNVQQVTFGKEKALKVSVSGWKQDYTFMHLGNIEHTELVLSKVVQSYKEKEQSPVCSSPSLRRPKASAVVQRNLNSFLLSPIEWKAVWANSVEETFSEGDTITPPTKDPALYLLVSGTVVRNTSPPTVFNQSGQLFNVASFLEPDRPPVDIVASVGPVIVHALYRADLMAMDVHQVMKFFASLSHKLVSSY